MRHPDINCDMINPVQEHYEKYPYPRYPLVASVRRCDTYALNLENLWATFNNTALPAEANRILLAGCGTFSPYPFAVANPGVAIAALDLSQQSLDRAKWHCLLHGKRNVTFHCGDLESVVPPYKTFGLIDSYGVLHHLPDPLAGMKALARMLAPGGILRVMLYSRYARREEESIRRAFRLLHVDSPDVARKLLAEARPGSRLAAYRDSACEVGTDGGLADALLHPEVRTFRISGLLEICAGSGLVPLLFAHQGALADPDIEIKRLKEMESERLSPGNIVVYLGRGVDNPLRQRCDSDSIIKLNPALLSAVSSFLPGSLQVSGRIGLDNPPLHYRERRFLRRFARGIRRSELAEEDYEAVEKYRRLLFLAEYKD